MDQKVKEFIEAARTEERKDFERQRDALLMSLGFVKAEKERRYANRRSTYFPYYDEDKKQYFGEFTVPVDVTDEEYEEIKRITGKNTHPINTKNNSAENFLRVMNIISLIIGFIMALILLILSANYGPSFILISGIVILTSLTSWAIIKVLLNISNNLQHS